MSQVKNFHILIEGRVQGVGFRRFVHQKAQARNLKGWVRNLLDGRVEVKVTGDAGSIEALVEELKEGPAFSRVRNVQVNPLTQALENFFEIAEDEAPKGKT